MKKRVKLTIVGAVVGVIAIALIIMRQYVSMSRDGTSISIIGGSDGPTSIFIAGKLPQGDQQVAEYTSITMEEAKEIFAASGNYIILDVRRADEFVAGHIPGAINIANEDIVSTKLEELPNKEQTIYVYCRSGNRSKQASAKLVAMGYTNIIEIGGILDWTGEIEK
ncbi:MAG: rhodanese-like domain-containing protein [Lachnospiraceae bacterium]